MSDTRQFLEKLVGASLHYFSQAAVQYGINHMATSITAESVLLEHVARKMYESQAVGEWEKLSQLERQKYLTMASAALNSLKELAAPRAGL